VNEKKETSERGAKSRDCEDGSGHAREARGRAKAAQARG